MWSLRRRVMTITVAGIIAWLVVFGIGYGVAQLIDRVGNLL